MLQPMNFKEELTQIGLKSTPKRVEILKFLSSQKKPMAVEEIHRAVKKKVLQETLDLVTVYRNLKQLVEVGLVRKSFFDEGRVQYSMAENEDHDHDHHIQCIRCERIEPVQICLPLNHKKHFTDLGYQNISHRLEFFGVCSPCQLSAVSVAKKKK